METDMRRYQYSDHLPFKSYYVVWKLNGNERIHIAAAKFKSYYVVWKPRRNAQRNEREIRLNRTMQYGNSGTERYFEMWGEEFKSYYVVWKPPYNAARKKGK